MVWKIKLDARVEKELKKLGHPASQQIFRYLEEIAQLDNPRSRGKELRHELGGLWRYRIGKYRIICELRDDTLMVLVLRVGHRGDIYE